MTLFTGLYIERIQGDFFEKEGQNLVVQPIDLWQLQVQPKGEAPQWRKELFTLLYAHLERLQRGFKCKTEAQRTANLRAPLPSSFVVWRVLSVTTSIAMTLVTVMETAEFWDGDRCAKDNACEFLDSCMVVVDTISVGFFVIEFLLRFVAKGWWHLFSFLGLVEILSIFCTALSLGDDRPALLHPKAAVILTFAQGAVVPGRLLRLLCIEPYFGISRAIRKVVWVTASPLRKSFYVFVCVWLTHAGLLHLIEAKDDRKALGGAQVPMSKEGRDLAGVVVPVERAQSERFGSMSTTLQYSLVHLTGDFPLTEYDWKARIVLFLGIFFGTCTTAAFIAIFSSSFVNYLANEVEDQLEFAAETRMLQVTALAKRMQRIWRQKKAGGGSFRRASVRTTWRQWAQKLLSGLLSGNTDNSRRLLFFFQVVLVVNIVVNLLRSIPEVEDTKGSPGLYWFAKLLEINSAVSTIIFIIEFVLNMMAGSGRRQRRRWIVWRCIDVFCILPAFYELWSYFFGESLEQRVGNKYQLLMRVLYSGLQFRTIRVLDFPFMRKEVNTLIDGIQASSQLLVVPVCLALDIWVFVSALFMWLEWAYDGPSKEFFTSVPTTMYWTSSFLIGEWTLVDFSPGGGTRVCMAVCLFCIMLFAIPMGILMEGISRATALAAVKDMPISELVEEQERQPRPRRQQSLGLEVMRTPSSMNAVLKKAAKQALLTAKLKSAAKQAQAARADTP